MGVVLIIVVLGSRGKVQGACGDHPCSGTGGSWCKFEFGPDAPQKYGIRWTATGVPKGGGADMATSSRPLTSYGRSGSGGTVRGTTYGTKNTNLTASVTVSIRVYCGGKSCSPRCCSNVLGKTAVSAIPDC